MPRRPTTLKLTDEEREALVLMRRRPKEQQRMVERAEIVLLASTGEGAASIGRRLELRKATVLQWIARFRESGLAGLKDLPRSGRPKRFDEKVHLAVAALAVEDPELRGEFRSRWTVRSLANAYEPGGDEPRPSKSAVARMLAAAHICTNRSRVWLFSKDPELEAKVKAIADVLVSPPPDTIVYSVDEKTSIQALERTHPTSPPAPGRPRRVEHGYKRHGVVDLFAAYAPATGDVHALVTPCHTHVEFGFFLTQLVDRHPTGRIILIMDNHSIHKHRAIQEYLAAQGGRVTVLFTPTHASWINPVEGWFSILARRALRDRSFASKDILVQRLYDFVEHWCSNDKKPLRWRFRGFPPRKVAASIVAPSSMPS